MKNEGEDCKSKTCQRERLRLLNGFWQDKGYEHAPGMHCSSCGPFSSHWVRDTRGDGVICAGCDNEEP